MSYEQTNDDLLYVEDSYFTPDGYYVYIALAKVAIGPYIEDGYIDALYYEDYSSVSALSCELTEVLGQTVEANGSWSSQASVSADVERILASAVSLSAEASQTADATRTRSLESQLSTEATTSAQATRVIEFAVSVTGAFTPTLTAEAIKNMTAIIDAVTAVSVDAVANRAVQITLDTILALSSQAVKTVDIQSSQSMAASASIQAQTTKSLSSQQSAQFQLTADVLSVQLAQSAITASASLSTTRYFGSLRPRTVVTSGTEFDSTVKKYGTHSIRKGYWYSRIPPTSFLRNDTELLVGNSEEFVIEFWAYRNHDIVAGYDDQVIVYSGGSNPSSANITFSQLNSADQWAFGLMYNNGFATHTYRFSYRNSSGSIINIESSTFNTLESAWPLNTWTHFAIRRGSDGVIRILRNNTQLASGSYSGAFGSTGVNFVKMHSLNGTTPATQYTNYDEFSYRIGNSTVSGYTGTISSDFDTQRLLLHFDNTVTDDIAIVQSGQASLSVTATLSAQANANTKLASADLSSAATVQASVTSVKVTDAGLASEFNQTAAVTRIRPAASDQQSESSVQATVGVIKQFDINAGALFTPQITVQAQLAGVALLEAQTTQTVTAVKTTDIESDLSSAVTLDFSITYTAGADSQQSVTADQSTVGQRIRFADADLSSAATVTATGNRIPPISAAIESQFAFAVQETKFRPAQADLSSAISQTTLAVKTTDVTGTQSSQFTQTADNIRVRFFDSAQTATATVSAIVVKTTDVTSTQSAETTQSATAVKTTDITVNAGALFTPSLDADANFAGFALLESTASLTVLAGTIKVLGQDFNAGVASYETNRYPRIGPLSGMPFGGLDIQTVGFTVSIWARRRSTGTYQVLWSPSLATLQTPLDYRTALIIDNDNVRLRSTFDPDEPGATWENAAPTDTGWHHYFFQTYRSQGTSASPGRYFRLWIDGVYKGEDSYSATMAGKTFRDGGYLNLGEGTRRNIYDEATAQSADMDFAQVWVGIMPSDVIRPDLGRIINDRYSVLDFYNSGYVDLGSGQGVFGDLPQPYIYNELDQPWTTVSFEGTYTTADKAARLSLNEPTAHSEFKLTAEPVIRVVALGQFTAQTTQITVANAEFDQDSVISAQSSLAVDTTQIIGIVASVSATAIASVEISKTAGYDADLTSQTTVICQPGYTEFAQGSLASTATLEIDITVKPPVRADAVLTSAFTVSADVSSFTDATALVMSAGTLACEATLIPPTRGEADLVSEFALTATIGAIEQFAALTASAGTMTVTPNFTASANAQVTAEASQNTQAVKFTGIILELTAFYSTLTVGDVVNIDPYLQLKIAQETRTLKIHPEQRTVVIEGESRLLQIQGYEQ